MRDFALAGTSIGIACLLAGCGRTQADAPTASSAPTNRTQAAAAEQKDATMDQMPHTDEAWQERLTPEQYRVLRQKGTEPAFTGEYVDLKEKGTYRCAGCGQALFDSDTKYKSGTGWPSFWQPASAGAVEEVEDRSYGMIRTEVVCSRCGGHLGHVFADGPPPTGQRYCINSVSLQFEAEEDE